MSDINFGWSRIILDLDYAFIRKYDLHSLIDPNIFAHIGSVTFNQPGKLKYPFKFPPFKKEQSVPFQNEFLKLFESLIDRYDIKPDPHLSKLLFFAYAYESENQSKKSEIQKQNRLRSNGISLLELLTVPLPEYTRENLCEAFENDDLSPKEVEDRILMYLGVTSNQPESEFMQNDRLDWNKVNNQVFKKLLRRIHADTNTSLEMENGKFLIISKEIGIKFNYNRSGNFSFSSFGANKNVELTQLVFTSLFEEQHREKTDFYDALLDHDFDSNDSSKGLSKILGLWNRSSHHTHNLKNLYDLVKAYLSDNCLIKFTDDSITTRKTNDFLYEYLILLGLSAKLNDNSVSQYTIKGIKENLDRFKKNKTALPTFANAKFRNSFKNLDR
ncbi:hypothetical protein SAMN05216464_101887 [Mucilaginibacter pineti]|uniref:Uncharacterized protein n=1 Tax=Mucilaginibacter pineti TaxID=1391627 RepID=A0A1G6V6M4_9SPHI|nr:hypothetical protein [Mucilaginibacter pineti]SDD49329.1 hypothetical protein SAMN05216464_101887 [Mucilaginibacter pineti]